MSNKYVKIDDLLDAVMALPAKMDEAGYGWLGRRGIWQTILDFPNTKDVERLERDYRDCRNELCLKCGAYKERHLGSCDGCRWYEK